MSVVPEITAAQSYKRGAKNPVLSDLDDLQKQPKEYPKFYKEGIIICF